MPSYSLISGFEKETIVSWQAGSSVSLAKLVSSAHAVAERLPDSQYVLNLCDSRYQFMVAFLATLMRKKTILLPPARTEATLRKICDTYPNNVALADNRHFSDINSIDISAYASTETNLEIPTIDATHVAVVIFTSGSTGQPAPHAKTWGELVQGAKTLSCSFGMDQANSFSVMGTVPPQHMFGLETTIMFPLQFGHPVHAACPLFPADIISVSEDILTPYWLMTTPLHLRACMAENISPGRLNGVISATMPLDYQLAHKVEQAWRVPVLEIYGSTETGMIATRRTIASDTWRMASGMHIWNEDDQAWIVGAHVTQPFALADRIIVHNETEFTLVGRARDLIKIAGKRTSLQALNLELNSIPGVIDGAFYFPEPSHDTSRTSAFVVAPGVPKQLIMEQLRKRIDPVFLPRPLCMVDALPRTDVGKLPYKALQELAENMIKQES